MMVDDDLNNTNILRNEAAADPDPDPDPVIVTIRGIRNRTGTACHITCALITICHCLVPIRDELIRRERKRLRDDYVEQENDDNEIKKDLFLRELANFFQKYIGNDPEGESSSASSLPSPATPSSQEAIDPPTSLFVSIKECVGIEANELGDAVTALAKILERIRTYYSSLQEETTFQKTIDSGRVHFRIVGTQEELDDEASRVEDVVVARRRRRKRKRRIKETKAKPMACPFSITCGNYGNLEDAIKSMVQPKVLEGYKWSGKYAEEEVEAIEANNGSTATNHHNHNDEIPSDGDGNWRTTKSLVVDQLPEILMVHMNDTTLTTRRQPNDDEAQITIPPQINFRQCLMGNAEDVMAVMANNNNNNNNNNNTGDDKIGEDQQQSAGEYTLLGGIVHVIDMEEGEDGSDDPDEENGHYVAVVRRRRRNSFGGSNDGQENGFHDEDDNDTKEQQQQQRVEWWLIDDDETCRISQDTCLQLLGGCTNSNGNSRVVSTKGTQGTYMKGVLLIYSSNNKQS